MAHSSSFVLIQSNCFSIEKCTQVNLFPYPKQTVVCGKYNQSYSLATGFFCFAYTFWLCIMATEAEIFLLITSISTKLGTVSMPVSISAEITWVVKNMNTQLAGKLKYQALFLFMTITTSLTIHTFVSTICM